MAVVSGGGGGLRGGAGAECAVEHYDMDFSLDDFQTLERFELLIRRFTHSQDPTFYAQCTRLATALTSADS